MNIPSHAQIEHLRAIYPAGARVELVSMDDPYTRLLPGERGTVVYVDDVGTVHIRWDCGSGLGVVPGVDCIRKLEGGRSHE